MHAPGAGHRMMISLSVYLFVCSSDPPGVPEIEGYQDGDIVQVGDTLTLACISRGGNPPATLTWTKDGVLLTAKYKNATREATNTYTFTVTAGDNNAVYRCEATNLVTLQPFEASVKLSVLCE